MKHRYSNNKELCRAYATGESTDARGNNMFFADGRIYSYGSHFCIASICRRTKVAFFTTRDYSLTTTRHKSRVYMALLRAGFTIYEVPDPEACHRGDMTALREACDWHAAERDRKLGMSRRAHTYKLVHWEDACRHNEQGRAIAVGVGIREHTFDTELPGPPESQS